jgi:multiple sugar transport system substrate-binding protein
MPKAVTLKFWSHWAEEENKKTVLMAAAKRFEQANPGATVEFTWWQKAEMFPAMRNAFTAGKGFPDVFYFDHEAREFVRAGWLADLTNGIDWKEVEDWAKATWTKPGPDGKTGVWAVPLEFSTEEIYYNKDIFDKVGIKVPADYQFTSDEFLDLCKKIRAAGYDPCANGIGDSPVTGSYLNEYALSAQLGPDELAKLYLGEKSWKDSDVVTALSYVKKLLDVPVNPATYATMKVAEQHVYFHTLRKAAMYPVGGWYTGRAFVPPEKGGQPKDFRLGMLRYPVVPNGKGKNVMLCMVGGTIAVAEKSANKELALKLLQQVATIETGTMWVEKTAVLTGMKTRPAIGGDFKEYFAEMARVHAGQKLAPVAHRLMLPPKLYEAYNAVLVQGWPLGLIKLEDALAKMEEARLSLKT